MAMPKIPRIRKTMFPNQMWEVTPKQNRFFFTDEIPNNGMRMSLVAARTRAPNKVALNRMFNNNISKAVPVQGPDLPWAIEDRRQAMKAAQEAYEAEMAEERARQAYNRKLYNDAIRQRKEELWRDYYQNNEGAMDAISPRQMKRLDSEFDNRARWQVRGIEDPEDPYGWSEMDEAEFREYYKDVPWRMW